MININDLPKHTRQIQGVNHTYSILPLVPSNSPILHEVMPEFNFNEPPINPAYLGVSLLETMANNGGVGLASPQVGIPYRVFVMGDGTQGGYVCFNPEVVSSSGNTAFDEGCLSFKGLFLNIKRPAKIDVKFQDMGGTVHTTTFTGITARAFQHELDHLNGILYTDLVHPYFLQKAKTKVPKNLKRIAANKLAYEKQMIIKQAMDQLAQQKRDEELNKQLAATVGPVLSFDIPNLTITTADVGGS